MVKARLVVLAKMFYEKTDEDHPMTGLQILEYLDEHDVPANAAIENAAPATRIVSQRILIIQSALLDKYHQPA